jgi:hypothetical protein
LEKNEMDLERLRRKEKAGEGKGLVKIFNDPVLI